MIDTLLFACLSLSLLYLIYRYHRYSEWWKTDAGRAYMTMKVSLLSLSTFRFFDTWFLGGVVEDAVRAAVVSTIIGAVFYQIRAVVKSQGGFRRQNRPIAEYTEPHQPMT